MGAPRTLWVLSPITYQFLKIEIQERFSYSARRRAIIVKYLRVFFISKIYSLG